LQDILVSLLHTEGLLGEGEEEQVHTQYALVEKWREVEKESSSSLLNPILNEGRQKNSIRKIQEVTASLKTLK
jgi:hypothetical protein